MSGEKKDDESGVTLSPKKPRGFATWTPEKRREVASRGGKSAQEAGTGHSFTSETGREAGKKGGIATSKNRDHMRRIGALGGAAAHANKPEVR